MRRPTVSRERAERVLKALNEGERGDAVELLAVLRALPEGLDAQLLEGALSRSMHHGADALMLGRCLPRDAFDVYERLLCATPRWPAAIIARHLAVLEPTLRVERLREAIEVFEGLGRSRRLPDPAVVSVAASKPWLVEVFRAVVAEAQFAREHDAHRLALVRVLLEEGSDDSVDVLLPLVRAALTQRGTALENWRALLRNTPTRPALRQLREHLEARSADVLSAPPWLDRLAEQLELDAVEHLAWKFAVASFDGWQLRLDVSLAAPPYFTVTLGLPPRDTQFTAHEVVRNQLALSTFTALTDFPSWLASSSAQLGISWGDCPDGLSGASLRGKSRRTLARWHWSATTP